MKKTKDKAERQVTITPEERDIAEIIHVLKVNINTDFAFSWTPDACLTKGQMAFLVEILEHHQRTMQ